jgi:hypothetical protein
MKAGLLKNKPVNFVNPVKKRIAKDCDLRHLRMGD